MTPAEKVEMQLLRGTVERLGEALIDCYALLPPERARLVRRRTLECIAAVQVEMPEGEGEKA